MADQIAFAIVKVAVVIAAVGGHVIDFLPIVGILVDFAGWICYRFTQYLLDDFSYGTGILWLRFMSFSAA
jgi:hypothetical protein